MVERYEEGKLGYVLVTDTNVRVGTAEVHLIHIDEFICGIGGYNVG